VLRVAVASNGRFQVGGRVKVQSLPTIRQLKFAVLRIAPTTGSRGGGLDRNGLRFE
jgi:hypothetical protein